MFNNRGDFSGDHSASGVDMRPIMDQFCSKHVINLDIRLLRYKQTVKNLQDVCLQLGRDWKRFPATPVPKRFRHRGGATAFSVKDLLVRDYEQYGDSPTFHFEDDVYFNHRLTQDIIDHIAEYLGNNDWEVLRFDWCQGPMFYKQKRKIKKISEYIYLADAGLDCRSSGGMGFSGSIMKHISHEYKPDRAGTGNINDMWIPRHYKQVLVWVDEFPIMRQYNPCNLNAKSGIPKLRPHGIQAAKHRRLVKFLNNNFSG